MDVWFLGLLPLALVSPAQAAEIELPPYPYVENDTFAVDSEHLGNEADAYCEQTATPDAVSFYLGELAWGSFDGICEASPTEVTAILGELYLSGYYGGVWLRDVLNETSVARLRAGQVDVWERIAIAGLAASAGKQVDRSLDGGNGEVLLSRKASFPFLSWMYGYNLGYLQVILENPPEGAPAMDDALVCDSHLMSCRSPEIPLEVLDTYWPAIDALESSRRIRWQALQDDVIEYGVPAQADGREVWEDILIEDEIALAAYAPLVDLSVGFLMVSDAAALASAQAWGEGDADAGRCALLQEAGLVIWAGSYFMGLGSDLPVGTFPTLSCEEPGL